MEKDLTSFLSKYIPLSEDDKEVIRELSLLREVKKGTILLKEGEIARECYLVLQGCVRSYFIDDRNEKCTEFFTENQPIVPVSYIQKEPSAYYLECVEDCVLSVGTEHNSEILRQKVPQVIDLTRAFNERLLAESQVKFENFFTLSPHQRYLKLLETRPDLCQRVPQYQLASYLGIQPESLSRIRRKMANGRDAS